MTLSETRRILDAKREAFEIAENLESIFGSFNEMLVDELESTLSYLDGIPAKVAIGVELAKEAARRRWL